MARQRLQVLVRGVVQGVGFRPAVHHVAQDLGLDGWVSNAPDGVEIEVEGDAEIIAAFVPALLAAIPARAVVHGLETRTLDPQGYRGFEVRASRVGARPTSLILPDIATCPECLRELFDPNDRRFGYPFINCTHCGPRFTIIEALPYDRERTTMARFVMCERCRAEYDDPRDRRFHAQPNACPACGPHLEAWDASGMTLSHRADALRMAVQAVRAGRIVAVKGIGGFHLVCDARDERAVRELRRRKRREEKPFAVMVPDLAAARALCEIDAAQQWLLAAPEAPIVLARRVEAPAEPLAPSVAPRNPYLGLILPYAPLHHLLMRELGHPVVATSGNLTDEPIATDERDALERLAGIADLFLVHDRPITRYADDSVARIIGGRPMLLRRARGYAPLPLARSAVRDAAVLSVGAHFKNTIGFTVDGHMMLSHHLGDLDTPQALEAFRDAATGLPQLYGMSPALVVHDLHPDYASTQFAESLGVRRLGVQHHHAHVLSCMADNDLRGEVLGVSWDGTGLGTDRTIWGGEFLHVREGAFRRCAHLRTFPLPGGDGASRDPRRSALGVLHELVGQSGLTGEGWAHRLGLSREEMSVLSSMLASGTGVVRTSSAGRLFDAVSALMGLCRRSSFEGQAAMEVEFAATGVDDTGVYPLRLDGDCVDWIPTIGAMIAEADGGISAAKLARRFHNTLGEMIVAVAGREGITRVCLTGGCFQNRLLSEIAIERLRAAGFTPYWHQRVPPNDGGIALGQLMAAWYQG